MPNWDQLMQFLEGERLCAFTFLLLVLHMFQEEWTRRKFLKQYPPATEKEE